MVSTLDSESSDPSSNLGGTWLRRTFFSFRYIIVSFRSPRNRPYSYSRYWTGTSLQWRLMRGNITKKRFISFVFEKAPHISLSCKLVPVQYREYEYGLFKEGFSEESSRKKKEFDMIHVFPKFKTKVFCFYTSCFCIFNVNRFPWILFEIWTLNPAFRVHILVGPSNAFYILAQQSQQFFLQEPREN